MIRALIADDEVLARQKLQQLLMDEPDVEILGECINAAETLQLAFSTRPDLLFLDIHMPGMDGFDVIHELSASNRVSMPQIVFITAYDQYAVQAFECHAADYLLKPFRPERLRSALDRVRERLRVAGQNGAERREAKGGSFINRMVFRSGGRILFLPVDEICWIEAEENYVRIHTAGESHLLRETMGRLEERLDPHMFLRVHRSSMVNLCRVREVKTSSEGEAVVVLLNGQMVSMSRAYRSRMHRLLRK